MNHPLEAKVTVNIKAPIEKVWEGVTNPELVKKYFFGTNVQSDWKVGSPITFSGEWEGKSYVDKGTILEIAPPKLLRYSYWSALSGKEDKPENYLNITYKLTMEGENTKLEIIQESESEEKKAHSEKNWAMVMEGLKKLIE